VDGGGVELTACTYARNYLDAGGSSAVRVRVGVMLLRSKFKDSFFQVNLRPNYILSIFYRDTIGDIDAFDLSGRVGNTVWLPESDFTTLDTKFKRRPVIKY
jgi:hypothetical protein